MNPSRQISCLALTCQAKPLRQRLGCIRNATGEAHALLPIAETRHVISHHDAIEEREHLRRDDPPRLSQLATRVPLVLISRLAVVGMTRSAYAVTVRGNYPRRAHRFGVHLATIERADVVDLPAAVRSFTPSSNTGLLKFGESAVIASATEILLPPPSSIWRALRTCPV